MSRLEGSVRALVRCLAAASPTGTAPLEEAVMTALGHGGHLFEVVVGEPWEAYGARLTFVTDRGVEGLAERLDVADHPWGAPNWIGLRMGPDGRVETKAYHRLERLDERFALPGGLPTDLVPVMAALKGEAREVYLRQASAGPWTEFVGRCTAPLGGASRRFSPHPRPADFGFCVSLAWVRDELDCVTVYADQECLWDDETIASAWCAGMAERDRRAYELALAGVRSLGSVRPDARHAMLAWTLNRHGAWRRSVSLRVPDLAASD